MKKRKRLITGAALLVICLVAAVLPTYSWLSSKSETVVNKFAGGTISIAMDEAKVDADGKKVEGDDAQRVTSNSYKYTAGAVLDKDPTPTVIKGSDECYVFVCVENQLSDKFSINYDADSWKSVATQWDKTVYAYVKKVAAKEAEKDITLPPVFTQVKVSENLTSEDIENLGEKNLNVTAYALQTASLDSKEAIDIAVKAFLGEDAKADRHITIEEAQ